MCHIFGPPSDWHATAERFADALGDTSREDLAGVLRLPVVAVAVLRVGWDGTAWTFPECDGTGRIVGIGRRFRDGGKVFPKGGERGLTPPVGWEHQRGPLFVVEGPSDALATTHAGLCCVDRPRYNMGALSRVVINYGWTLRVRQKGIRWTN